MYTPILYSVVAIVISYIVITYLVPLAFPKLDFYNKFSNKLSVEKVAVPLTMGSCNFDDSSIEINTSNPDKKGFVFMPNSNNLKGGSQFSYSFWLDIKSTFRRELNGVNIFMRGNPILNKGVVISTDNVSSPPLTNKYPLVACPLVRFPDNLNTEPTQVQNNIEDRNTHSRGKNLLEIVFNTKNNPHNIVYVDGDVYDKITSTNSNPKWFLITMVFQDYIDFSNSERGIQIQNFINDNLVSTKIIKNDALKLNNSNFHITPNNIDEADKGSSLFGDITYYNYALDIIEIQNIYKNGVTNTSGGCITAKYSKTEDKYHTLGMDSYLS